MRSVDGSPPITAFEGLTLVGYSQGAALAEQLVQRWPSRYARVVLIGAPTDPSTTELAAARAIVTVSCARDVPSRMKDATRRFLRAGIPSIYAEMPTCTHGNIAEGDATFDAAFTFLRDASRLPASSSERAPRPSTADPPLLPAGTPPSKLVRILVHRPGPMNPRKYVISAMDKDPDYFCESSDGAVSGVG